MALLDYQIWATPPVPLPLNTHLSRRPRKDGDMGLEEAEGQDSEDKTDRDNTYTDKIVVANVYTMWASKEMNLKGFH